MALSPGPATSKIARTVDSIKSSASSTNGLSIGQRSPGSVVGSKSASCARVLLCTLVMIGVTADGTKELVALEDGYRESTESWASVLRDGRPPAVRWWSASRRRCGFPISSPREGAHPRPGARLVRLGRVRAELPVDLPQPRCVDRAQPGPRPAPRARHPPRRIRADRVSTDRRRRRPRPASAWSGGWRFRDSPVTRATGTACWEIRGMVSKYVEGGPKPGLPMPRPCCQHSQTHGLRRR